jgi:hypothetical protein
MEGGQTRGESAYPRVARTAFHRCCGSRWFPSGLGAKVHGFAVCDSVEYFQGVIDEVIAPGLVAPGEPRCYRCYCSPRSFAATVAIVAAAAFTATAALLPLRLPLLCCHCGRRG